MGARLTLVGKARDIQKTDRGISFTIVTGPATSHPPRGLNLYGPVQYRVECSPRQWRRARHRVDDPSDLIVEGYLEPHRDPESAQLYVAVIATTVQSTLAQDHRKLQQLTEVLDEARDEYRRARQGGCDRSVLEEKAAAFVKANEGVQHFLQAHPDLLEDRLES